MATPKAPVQGHPPRTRKTIGALVDWLKNGYQNLVLAGMHDAAMQLDVNLLCFPGGVFGSEVRFQTTRNLIYDYVGPHVADGLVLMTGTLANQVGPAVLGRYCERYRPLPMTSIGVQLDGISTVMVDDAEGIRCALRHLIDVHGLRRIAFVRGPQASVEAERRFAAYREVLDAVGIPFDDDLVAPGDFQVEAGVDAVRLLRDDRQVSFQALVAANDHMALGAMKELKERGVRVPQDIALIGFDDIDEARFSKPSLTTIRQPLYQQGQRALRTLVSRIDAGDAPLPDLPDDLCMPTELVVRDSCGCTQRATESSETGGDVPLLEGDLPAFLSSQRRAAGEALRRAESNASGAAEAGWEDLLLDAAVVEIDGRSPPGRFATVLEHVLRPVVAAGTDMAPWHAVVTTLRRLMMPAVAPDAQRSRRADDLWHAARMQIADAAERVQARQKLEVKVWARALSETSEALLANVEVPALVRTVADQMRQLGIESCFLALYPPGDGDRVGNAHAPDEARLMLAYRAGAPARDLPPDGEPFAARELLPASAWPRDRRWTMIAEPLNFERTSFGTILIEMGPREGVIYESLREQISSALNSARLVGKVVQEATQRHIAESDRRKSVQDLFDNMQQAIFTIGPDLIVGQEVSAYARRVFGDVPVMGVPVTDVLRLDTVADLESVSRMRFWLQCIFGTDDLQWMLSGDEPIRTLVYQRPKGDGTFDERTLDLDYAPIYDGAASIAKVMFIVKDVTEILRLQAEVARKDQQSEETLSRVKQIAGLEPGLFATFVREAEQILNECELASRDLEHPARRVEAIRRIFRGMHTLKGNARIFNLTTIQRIAHTAEDYFEKVRDGDVSLTAESAAELAGHIREVRGLVGEFERLGRQVLGLSGPDEPDHGAAAFLRGTEVMLERWRGDVVRLEEAGDSTQREELEQTIERFRGEARACGLASVATAVAAFGRAFSDPARALAEVGRAIDVTRGLQSLLVEIPKADLLPYFFDECDRLLNEATDAPPARGSLSGGMERAHLLITLFGANAACFGLPTLAAMAARALEGGGDATEEGGDPPGYLVSALEDATASCRALAKGLGGAARSVDLLARFDADARALLDRMRVAQPRDGATLIEEARACTRRFQLRRAIDVVERTITAADVGREPAVALAAVAEALSGQLGAYRRIRDELRGAPDGHRLLADAPDAGGLGPWMERAARAGLGRLAAQMTALPHVQALELLDDVRHLDVVIPSDADRRAGRGAVRVPEARLDELRRAVQKVQRGAGGRSLGEIDRAVRHLTTSSLADLLEPVAQRALELARDRGKLLRPIAVEGLDLFLEPGTMQKLRDAIAHALVNAVDHGLEAPPARCEAGKAMAGRIAVRAREEPGWMIIQIDDDGRGIDRAAIAAQAVRSQLVSVDAAAAMTERDACEILFQAGFTTSSARTDLSGRGVGMDAIRSIARELGGDAALTSIPGKGTSLAIRIPAAGGARTAVTP